MLFSWGAQALLKKMNRGLGRGLGECEGALSRISKGGWGGRGGESSVAKEIGLVKFCGGRMSQKMWGVGGRVEFEAFTTHLPQRKRSPHRQLPLLAETQAGRVSRAEREGKVAKG